jgi:hypothetical protein
MTGRIQSSQTNQALTNIHSLFREQTIALAIPVSMIIHSEPIL